jgi:hypothetical protein
MPMNELYGYGQHGSVQMPDVPAHVRYSRTNGLVGRVRPTGVAILLFVVTFGIYGLSCTTTRRTRR